MKSGVTKCILAGVRGPDGAPEALIAQARAAQAVAAAARRYFDGPGEAAAALARRARLAAKRARTAADAALEIWPGKRGDWLAVSAALADLSDEAAWAVEEDERFQARLDLFGRRIAGALEQAAARLVDALENLRASGESLAEAKSKALQIEDIRRMARQNALEQPRLAVELSARAVLDRFSLAGEAVHRAADAVAARVAEVS